MSTIVGKENAPASLKHIKGNDFIVEFTFDGVSYLTAASATISRIDDPDKTALISFAVGNGLSIAGLTVVLTKTDAEMNIPRGWYAFELVATTDNVSQTSIKKSILVVE